MCTITNAHVFEPQQHWLFACAATSWIWTGWPLLEDVSREKKDSQLSAVIDIIWIIDDNDAARIYSHAFADSRYFCTFVTGPLPSRVADVTSEYRSQHRDKKYLFCYRVGVYLWWMIDIDVTKTFSALDACPEIFRPNSLQRAKCPPRVHLVRLRGHSALFAQCQNLGLSLAAIEFLRMNANVCERAVHMCKRELDLVLGLVSAFLWNNNIVIT